MVLLVLDGILEFFDSLSDSSLVFLDEIGQVKAGGLSISIGVARLDADSLSNGEEGCGSESLHCSCRWYFFLLLNYIAKAALL